MDILPRFPMTQKGKTICIPVPCFTKHFIDAKNCLSASTLPYQLVSSPTYFKTLVTGRRKAIEVIQPFRPYPMLTFDVQWGRARAIQGAYCQIIEETSPGEDVIPLNVGDVYSWLSKNGHFPVILENRIEQREIKNDGNHPLQLREGALERWCSICGLDIAAHLWESVCKEETPIQDMDIRNAVSLGLSRPKLSHRCHIVPMELQTMSFPVFDIRRFTSGQSEQMATQSLTRLYPAKALVAIADPILTESISRIVNALGLKHFAPLEMPYDELTRYGKADMERNLAPCSLMAVMARLFIRLLVERGLEVATRDKKNVADFFSKKRNGRITSMLTPTHILSGVRELDNVLWCLARMGVGMSDGVSSGEMRIKRRLNED